MPQMSPLSWLSIVLTMMIMFINVTSNMQKTQKISNYTHSLKKNENPMKW